MHSDTSDQYIPVPRRHVRVEARQHFCLISRQGSGWVFVTPLYGDTASLGGKNPAAMPRLLNRGRIAFLVFRDSVERGRFTHRRRSLSDNVTPTPRRSEARP